MRRVVWSLLCLCTVLILPVVAQQGGRGFRGGIGGFDRRLVRPGYRGGFTYRGFGGFGGGFFPGNRFVDFGVPGYWPDYMGQDYPDYGYRDYSYSTDAPAYSRSIIYGYGPPAVQQSPPKLIEYSGPAHTCPQANGKSLYRIAVPADNRERKIPPTYQNNLWVAQNYSFTDGTLNFTTVDGEQRQTSIRSVDRALTLQLNRECGANVHSPH